VSLTATAQTVALGVIEGVTEFLPISSTGHLLIAEHWLGERSELFNVAIQAGAILAITLLYWRRLLGLLRFSDAASRDYLGKLTLAFAVSMAGMFAVTRLGWKLQDAVRPIAIALITGGVAILVIEALVARRPVRSDVTWNVAIWVGIAQIIAGTLPGTSRSAAAIFAAMLAGLTARPAATEFAFIVGIPTMFAATGYELIKTHVAAGAGAEDWGALALGFVVAGVVAFLSVVWLLRYIQSHRFTVFAWYRIALGLALLTLLH
jgi:undecaprenyl-diphosphatase